MRVTRHLPAVAALIGILTMPMAAAEAQDTAATVDSSRPQQAGSDTLGHDSTSLRASGDSAAVQNPPGYRGMERDTTLFPPADDSAAAAADADATNRANQRARQDKLKEEKNQNPPGYRGMERRAG